MKAGAKARGSADPTDPKVMALQHMTDLFVPYFKDKGHTEETFKALPEAEQKAILLQIGVDVFGVSADKVCASPPHRSRKRSGVPANCNLCRQCWCAPHRCCAAWLMQPVTALEPRISIHFGCLTHRVECGHHQTGIRGEETLGRG